MKPLAGCRILDLGIITAGAATSSLLADLGADVIKIESPTYRDPFREWTGKRPADAEGKLAPFFRATNRNKRGVSLNLKEEAGREVFRRLAKESHVVVENFRRGVLAKLGLDYASLRAANSQIILASISSQGESGPLAGQVSYGSTLESVAGMAWATGYEGEAPRITGVELNYPDQVVAIFAAGMIVTAIYAQRNGQGGAHLDMSQRELTSFLLGETFVAEAAGVVSPARTGNAHPAYLLQDCFQALDGNWVAVSIKNSSLSDLHKLSGLERVTDTSALRSTVTGWIAARPAKLAITELAALGIPAAEAVDGPRLWRDKPWTHAILEATDGSPIKGFPFQFGNDGLSIYREAPQVGADTHEILQQIGGYTTSEIQELAAGGIIELPAAEIVAPSNQKA